MFLDACMTAGVLAPEELPVDMIPTSAPLFDAVFTKAANYYSKHLRHSELAEYYKAKVQHPAVL